MNDKTPGAARRMLRAVAWTAMVASFPVWFSAFLMPLLPLPVSQRAALVAVCIVAGEVLFWGAGFVLGAEVIARFRTPRVDTGQSFKGRRVAIVGATGGLGSALARAVAREGGTLVLIARDATRLNALAGELNAQAIIAELTPVSLRSAAEASDAVDHVVCATGIDVRRALLDHTDSDVAHQLDVALAGPIHVTRAFLPRLRAEGTIALFGGFADGRLALPFYTVDVAARAGLAAFCVAVNRELRVEARTERVCFVCPSPADTDAERPYAALWQQMGSTVATPERVANYVLGALLARKRIAVMGFSTRALAYVQAVAPSMVDWMVVRRWGPMLKRTFGTITRV
jgi:short-subunit dehydrogenase